jgi:hypothetical protein
MGGTTPNSDIQTNRPFRSLKLLLGLAATAVAIWCTGVGPLLWYQGTQLLPDRAGFGYYRNFNLVRDALESTSCVASVEYSRHEDLTLESFHFKIKTNSGWSVRLWFNEETEVPKVCFKPAGFVVLSPHDWKLKSQLYTVPDLAAALADRGVAVATMDDLLCNMGILAPLFKANYDNPAVPRITYKDPIYNRCLQVEILEEGRGNEFNYKRR